MVQRVTGLADSALWRNIRNLPGNIWALTLTSFLTDVSTEMIVHLIPFFLANVLGVRIITIGLIEGVAATTASLVKIGSGRLSDMTGRRKGLVVAGYALSTLAKPFLALASSWQAVLSVRFVERMGKGVRTPSRDALLADSVEPQRRGLAFGLHRAGDTAGAALGLLVAILVVWLIQGGETNLTGNTFRALVWLSIIPAVLSVAVLIIFVREKGFIPTVGQRRLAWPSLSPSFKRFLFIIALFTLGNSSDAFLILRAQERGLNILAVLRLLFLFNVVYALVSSPAGYLSDRLGRRRLLLWGWLLYASIYFGFALAQSGWQIGLLFVLYGLYYGLVTGSSKAFVADLVGQEQRGTAYGLFDAVVGLVAFPASLIAGLLWQGIGPWFGFGPSAPFLFGALLALLATLLLLLWLPGTPAAQT